MTALQDQLDAITTSLAKGTAVPYLGPGVLELVSDCPVPATPEALAVMMTAKVSVPHKIRKRLTQAAQFIENFKHRKSVVHLMNEAFTPQPVPSALHQLIARSHAPLVVDTWYDDTLLTAMAAEVAADSWGQVQGLSQSEHFGHWTGAFNAAGASVPEISKAWRTLVYKPIGSHQPGGNYLVSDSDFVEVLTEIDIQTPIPAEVQAMRAGKHFLFLGCRFNDQLTRTFARQIMKRSSDRHWAVLPDPPTRMEARFLEEQNITRLDISLEEFTASLAAEALA